MEASIIITTYNKAEYLNLTLLSLSTQNQKKTEIIIIDDGSKDNTGEVVRYWSSKMNNIYYQRGSNLGPAESRNNGARIAKGEILIFLDDDRIVTPSTIGAHIKLHKSLKSSNIIVGTRWETYIGNSSITRQRIYADIKQNHFMKYRRHSEPLSTTSNKKLLQHGPLWNLRWCCVLTGNLSIPRGLFNDLKGFDCDFLRLEDLEFGYRAVKMNIPVIYSPKIESFHLAHKRNNSTNVFLRHLQKMALKHPDISYSHVLALLRGKICFDCYEKDNQNLESLNCHNSHTSRIKYFTNV